MQRRAATRTGLVRDTDDNLDPRQISRQRTAVALRRRGPSDGLGRFDLGRLLGQGLFQVFDPLVQRFVAELFGATAEAISQQTGADSNASRPCIPTLWRPPFRFDRGHHSKLIPATRL
jgi:hypothetical protein